MRIGWIDALKGFAILTVVLGHVVQGYQVAGYFPEDDYFLKCIFDSIYSFHMPLFFLASGYLYEMTWNERNINIATRIKSKFFDMVGLYVIFSFLFWIVKTLAASRIQMNHLTSVQELLMIPVSPLSYLWFLYVLMVLFVVVPLLTQFISQRIIILAIFAVGYFVLGENGTGGRVFYGGFYFVLGSWLRQLHFEGLGISIKNLLMLMSLIICGVNSISYVMLGKQEGILHGVLIALSASYIVWYAVTEYEKRWDSNLRKFLHFGGQKCLELYLLHVYFVGCLRTVFRKVGVEDLFLCIIGCTILSVVGSLLIAHLCEKVPGLSFLFHPAELFRKRNLFKCFK